MRRGGVRAVPQPNDATDSDDKSWRGTLWGFVARRYPEAHVSAREDASNPGTRPLCLPGRPRGASGAGYFVVSATNTGITRVVFAWYSSYGGNAATASFQSRARSAAS